MTHPLRHRSYQRLGAILTMVAALMLAGPIGAGPIGVVSGGAPESLFTPHKAMYQMEMISSHNARSISSVGGKIFFEWADSCEAWTTNQRFELVYQYTEGSPENFISDYSSWEAKDGKSFSFTSKQSTGEQPIDTIRGSAERTKDGANVEYTRPESRIMKLASGFIFPSQHTFEVLRRAAAGQKFYSAQMFDGSDDQGSALVSTFITDRLPALDAVQEPNPLLRGPGYRVRMAFFDNPENGDPVETASPGYEMTMDLLENGIVRKIRIDYREFSIEGGIKTLDTVSPPNC